MKVWNVVLVVLAAGAGLPIALHLHAHGAASAHQIALAAFLWLNVLVALWELCLFFRIDVIRAQHDRWKVEYRGRELERVRDFFLRPVPAAQLLSPSLWAELWSSYSLFDDSYADKRSFGFFVDSGNGFVTLLPSLLFIYGMTFPLVAPRLLGIIGLLIFYQMLYGTVVYVASYLVNRRWRGHTPLNVAVFVALSNGLWLIFPVWGIAVSLGLVYSNSFGVFGW